MEEIHVFIARASFEWAFIHAALISKGKDGSYRCVAIA